MGVIFTTYEIKQIVLALKIALVLSNFRWCHGQCNGPPLYILPNNSTGSLAFPESNLDPMTGAWSSDHYYPVSVTCTWILKAPPQHVLYLKILFLNTEEKFDYVALYASEDREQELDKLYGDLKEVWESVTPDNTLVVDFISDEFISFHGFHFVFMYLPKACVAGGTILQESQLIALPPWNLQGVLPGPHRPGFEAPSRGVGISLQGETNTEQIPRWANVNPYPQGLNCTWHLKVEKSQLLRVDVLQFQTDADDVLQVWQIDGSELRPLLKYWNDQIPRKVITSSSSLLLNFGSRMNEVGNNSGFLLNVSYISRGCKETPEYRGPPSGLIGYPEHNLKGDVWQFEDAISYGPDDCRWVLQAPPGYAFNVSLLRLDTDEEDKLEIKDGEVEIFNEGGALLEEKHFTSDGNVVVINFSPQMESEKTGFLIRYNWILKDCKFKLDPGQGEVRSPFYPDVYGTAFQCSWTITPPQGSLASVLVARIRLDEGDFLQITDGVQNILYSQSTASTDLLEFVPDSSVSVKFLSNDVSNRGYFLLKYDTFTRGSCNFTLTTCGWNAVDPLQVWTFRAKESMVIVEEKAKIGYQLPRGYRTQLVSPLLMPSEAMCFHFKYILMGQDAFKLSVHVRETTPDQEGGAGERRNAPQKQLIKVHGAQGNFFLNAAVNFTASNPFHIFITYERGYGPHYKVGVDEIAFSNDFCGAEVQDLASFSCEFHSTFCGWKNTHTDHKNWELGNEGVTVFINEGQVLQWTNSRSKLQNQFADLLSPPLTSVDLMKQANGKPNLCLSLVYQIMSPVAELKIIIRTLNENRTEGSFYLSGSEVEQEIWGQGRAASPKVLKANIPMHLKSLPPRFEIILRGVSIRSDIPQLNRGPPLGLGVSVQKIDLESGTCPDVYNCDFEEGFCAWRVISTGNSVWHIKEEHNESFATMLSQGTFGDSSQMVSPSLSPNTARRLSFRYLIKDTNQCTQIAIMTYEPAYESDGLSTRSLNVIWEQCRGKGDSWLHECLDLPKISSDYQIIIGSGTGPINSLMHIDDIQISEGSCGAPSQKNGSTLEKEEKIMKTSWECRPGGSLCGMTQPLPGSWDWAYYHLPHESHQLLIHPNAIAEDMAAYRPPRKMMDRNAAYNNYDLDALSENREDLSSQIPLSAKHTDPYSHNLNLQLAEEPHSDIPVRVNIPGSSQPFVCPEGRALDPSWVCDGVPDCDDSSDEKECNCSEEGCGHTEDIEDAGMSVCEEGSFKCSSGLACFPHYCPDGVYGCLPKNFVCDGNRDCRGGEDESSCSHALGDGFPSSVHGWVNDSPQPSITREPRSYSKNYRGLNDANKAPRDFEDRFECSGGLFIPKSFVCDGRKDCPLDGLDEVGCFHCNAEDFLCPRSGVCLPRSKICDGEQSIPTCTDEEACEQCAPGHFACDACIPSLKVCDGVWDCSEGEDEVRCFEFSQQTSPDTAYSPSGTKHTVFEETSFSECQAYQFMCPDDRCLPMASVCDRKKDCSGGEDEHDCPDDNREEEYFIGASPSNFLGIDPWVHFPSYLVTPELHQEKDTISILSFRYRLDSWIGSSNVTLSVELLNAHDSRISIVPWALWRQTGHKGKLWLNTFVVIPELPDVTSFRLGFLLTGKGLEHRSEQIHLSKISFRGVKKENMRQMGHEWSKCEFSDSWCGWSQPYSEVGYSWAHATASPHSRRTGPITGFPDEISSGFIFTDSLKGRVGDTADLLSPPLLFNENCRAICFRFAVFLYGAHIAKLSVHVMQVTREGHSFNAELFHISGGRGQSWIPISVDVSEEVLKDPRIPYLLVVRATRGNGPEADIAFDHVTFSQGSCSGIESELDLDVLLSPMTSSLTAYIRTLKAGPSLTPFLQGTVIKEDSDQGKASPASGMNITGVNSLCSSLDSCFSCVSSYVSACVWCGSSNACFGGFSSEARSCPLQLTVHHNSSDEIRAGPLWCPRMAPGQGITKLLHSDSVIAEPFPVTNIPPPHTTSDWLCVLTLEIKDDSGAKTNLFQDHSLANETPKTERESETKRKDFSEDEENEELWERLKKYALKKKYRQRVIKVPGQFQGTLFRSSAQDESIGEIGVGAIRCGDHATLLQLPDGVPMARAKIELQNPDGAVLDNPEGVELLVYSCKAIAGDCEACLNLNSSFSCGWCSLSLECTPHEECKNGLWHSTTSSSSQVCSVQEELTFIKHLLEAEEDDSELGELEEEFLGQELNFKNGKEEATGTKKKVESAMKKSLENGKGERHDADNDGDGKGMARRIKARISFKTGTKPKGGKKRTRKNKSVEKEKTSGKGSSKGSVKLGRKGRGKSFLKVPIQNGIFVARDVWRLHTGRQYYVPVVKKILVNLGFVRHVTYGRLAEEKSRTILMDGAWKKAAGFFIDLYEKAGQDPMTSIITTSKDIFEKMLGQLIPE